jgi:hypothetical protein
MNAAEAIKNAPTQVLYEAAETLQKAHDWVEAHEFSMAYGAERHANACCFIGSVRQAAHEHDVEPMGPSENAASDLALHALDRAARAQGYVGGHFTEGPGGIAEATIVPRYDGSMIFDSSEHLKKPQALVTYRQALREMHTELINRKEIAA